MDYLTINSMQTLTPRQRTTTTNSLTLPKSYTQQDGDYDFYIDMRRICTSYERWQQVDVLAATVPQPTTMDVSDDSDLEIQTPRNNCRQNYYATRSKETHYNKSTTREKRHDAFDGKTEHDDDKKQKDDDGNKKPQTPYMHDLKHRWSTRAKSYKFTTVRKQTVYISCVFTERIVYKAYNITISTEGTTTRITTTCGSSATGSTATRATTRTSTRTTTAGRLSTNFTRGRKGVWYNEYYETRNERFTQAERWTEVL
eukprot:3634191-Amphidinium_carterae.1